MTNEIMSSNSQATKIEEILDYAWHQAVKYKFDPVIGRIHQDYLDLVKKMKNEIDKDLKP